jgi:hypothetical protein
VADTVGLPYWLAGYHRVTDQNEQPLYYCAMLNRLFFCLFLACLTVTLPTQLAHGAVINQVAQPSQAYFQLADEITRLFQRATALPTAQGSALVQKEAPALKRRITPVRAAYRRWLKSLSKSELTAENKRVASSFWGKYFSTLEVTSNSDPKFKALLKPGSPSGQLLLDLMGLFDNV